MQYSMSIQDKYNTFQKRFLAGLIDGIVFIPFAIFDNYFHDIANNTIFIAWQLVSLISWTLYYVIGHGKYGQTIGKKVVGIKVLNINEDNVIGYRKAFIREAVWIFVTIICLMYYAIESFKNPNNSQELRVSIIDVYSGMTMLVWFLLELVTMLFNEKRRALHDYIADSVVVK
jgi:uncharacterized RDD family membrane protein YckC